ncbi:fumarylacetoacetate hydrolase family protein [Aquabacterium sp. J223]|uniref:fumarylacetoacetate hydrolase family protein n=1 Tax=Aquabacterium sp. J223 TaxID=2898431 RepID=UPI0021AE02CC|nr:fumarylacetoacetate hydrolase family protein [Aquabacterium sp. J223]UUX97245.1 fumarylacetoacetate hydrolase family protein [Aquabacterium sp. J223]
MAPRRYCRARLGGQSRWFLDRGDHLLDLQSAVDGDDVPALLRHLADTDVTWAPPGGAVQVDPARVEWQVPVPRPGKVICLGLNYAAHAAEGGNAPPEYPALFLRAATSLIAHDAPLIRPRASDRLDFEAELAVVIGRRARHLDAAQALSAVAGYACFNDGTLRDYQRRTSQWTVGKNFDGTGAFGPWLVPAADLPPGATGLSIESRLNGQVMQRDNTGHMMVSVTQALVLLSEVFTLEPGDVIAMGTPAGVGYARTPPVFMKAGDRIEVEIEGLGVLANTVEDET